MASNAAKIRNYLFMPTKWKTLSNGMVLVKYLGEEEFVLPTVVMDARFYRVLSWSPLVDELALSSPVPLHWILGFVHRDSGGHPMSSFSLGAGGLLHVPQIRNEVLEPRRSLLLGIEVLGRLYRSVTELPEVASMYGTGQSASRKGPLCALPSSESPWGLRERAPGYVSAVVAAANTFALAREVGLGASPVLPPPSQPPAQRMPTLSPEDTFSTEEAATVSDRRTHPPGGDPDPNQR